MTHRWTLSFSDTYSASQMHYITQISQQTKREQDELRLRKRTRSLTNLRSVRRGGGESEVSTLEALEREKQRRQRISDDIDKMDVNNETIEKVRQVAFKVPLSVRPPKPVKLEVVPRKTALTRSTTSESSFKTSGTGIIDGGRQKDADLEEEPMEEEVLDGDSQSLILHYEPSPVPPSEHKNTLRHTVIATSTPCSVTSRIGGVRTRGGQRRGSVACVASSDIVKVKRLPVVLPVMGKYAYPLQFISH